MLKFFKSLLLFACMIGTVNAGALESVMQDLPSNYCSLIVTDALDLIKADSAKPVMRVSELQTNLASVCDLVVIDTRKTDQSNALMLSGVEMLKTHGKYVVLMESLDWLDSKLAQNLANIAFLETTNNKVSIMWTRDHVLAQFRPDVTNAMKLSSALDKDVSRKWRFNNELITAVAFHFEPYTTFDNGMPSGGYEFNIANTLVQSLGLRLRVRPPSDGQRWGAEHPLGSGNYSGLVGELSRNEVDLGWANLFVTAKRSEVIDFSEWYAIRGSCAAVPRPSAFPPYVALVLPYTLMEWLLIVLAALAMGVLLFGHYISASDSPRWSLTQVVGVVAALMFAQAHYPVTVVANNAIRIATLFFLLSMLVLTRDYGGSLTSLMAVTPAPPPLNSFSAMARSLKSNDLDHVYFCCTWLLNQARASASADLAFMGETSKCREDLVITDLLRMVGRYEEAAVAVFHAEHTLDYLTRKHLRGLEARVHVTQQCFGKNRIALGLPKRSLIKRAFDNNLIRLRGAGVLDHIVDDVLENVGRVESNNELDKYAPLALSQMQGPFLVAIGILLAAAIGLAIEILFGPTKNEQGI